MTKGDACLQLAPLVHKPYSAVSVYDQDVDRKHSPCALTPKEDRLVSRGVAQNSEPCRNSQWVLPRIHSYSY